MLTQFTLPGTDLQLSAIGLGTVKFGRNTGVKYPHAFTIPNDEAIREILNLAWNVGINCLDTAPAYGESEERLGRLLEFDSRPWVIMTKAGETFDNHSGQSTFDFSPQAIRESVNRSCGRLGRSQLDIVLIHSDGMDLQRIESDRALDTLAELKALGQIRAIGFSGKTAAGGLAALKLADIVMVTHNLDYQSEQAVIDQAQLLNKSVLIKKALASGHITDLESSFALSLQHPAVKSIILGTINPSHLLHNVQTAQRCLERMHRE